MKNLSSLFGALSVAARGSGSGGHTAAQGGPSSREDESQFPSHERLLLCPSPDTAQQTFDKVRQGDVVVIVYDLETTGLGKTETIGICELGSVAIVYTDNDEWIIIDSYHTYVMPDKKISADVPNNISLAYLKKQNAKPFAEECKKEFSAFVAKHSSVKPVIMCAHNGKRYDHRILAHHGWTSDCRVADSLQWFKNASPGRNSYSLKNLHEEMFGSGVPAAHNALPDVHALVRIMNSLKIKPEDCIRMSEHWDCVAARVHGRKSSIAK